MRKKRLAWLMSAALAAAAAPMLAPAALAQAGPAGTASAVQAASAQAPAPSAVDYADVARHYSELVHANYSDALRAAEDLRAAIAAFVAAPSARGLEKAREAWLAGREFYGQTEAFRFYAGPIDDDEGPEGQLNAWPLDEAYVDYVEGRADSGFVNDPRFEISKENLASANERGGEENVSTGWHAIEFLLWGQDLSETSPGERSFEDYVDGKAANADRRRQYLSVVTELLVDDLAALVEAWAPDRKDNYRAGFDQGGRESVRKIIVGLGSLSRGELAGERMEVALNSQDQEDEHSCFSDNTHRDAVTNAKGIQNVWSGRYQRRDGSLLSGPGLRDLVAASDAVLAERTTARIAASVESAEAIPAPFDRAILVGSQGRPLIEKTIANLVEQSKLLVESASAVGITRLTLVEP